MVIIAGQKQRAAIMGFVCLIVVFISLLVTGKNVIIVMMKKLRVVETNDGLSALLNSPLKPSFFI